MSDLISRQAALDIYDDYNVAVENGELEAYGKYRKRLLELPSAQPGWIPTSVRLPEEKTGVLITTTKGYVIQCMYWGYQNGHHTWRSLGGEHLYWEMDVLAWCELPTPYREGGQE